MYVHLCLIDRESDLEPNANTLYDVQHLIFEEKEKKWKMCLWNTNASNGNKVPKLLFFVWRYNQGHEVIDPCINDLGIIWKSFICWVHVHVCMTIITLYMYAWQ